MIAYIKDNQFVFFGVITVHEEETLAESLSVSKNNRYIDPTQRHLWDGVYRFYHRGLKRIPRPLLGMVIEIARKYKLPLTIEDLRPESLIKKLPVDQINNDFLSGITLAEYQVNAIRKMVSAEVGICDLPTGGGKTEIISGICKAISCPTVILADQTVVVQQIKERLELRDIAEEVGIFYAGQRPNGQTIVVGSVASLLPPKQPVPVDPKDPKYKAKQKIYETKLKAFKTRKKNAKELQQYVKDADMLIVDECDKASSNIYKYVFRHLYKGRLRYGFSGTPLDPDKPVEGFVMQSHLGSVIHKESRQHLTELGMIIPCTYYSIAFGLEGNIKDKRAYDIAVDDFMVSSDSFHSLVVRLIKTLVSKEDVQGKERDGTVLLVEREKLGDRLLSLLSEYNIKAEFIYGRTPKRRRSEVLHMFEQREIDVLIGGKIINRGLDLKGGCENLIIATGGKLQSEFIQKIGRALRRNKKGESKIYDIFFRCNRYLYNHSKARLNTMINAGYKTHVVFPGGKINGQEFVRSNYRIGSKYT